MCKQNSSILGENLFFWFEGTNELNRSKMVLWTYVEQGCTMKFHRGNNFYISDERLGPSYKASSQHPWPRRKTVPLNRRQAQLQHLDV